MEPVDPLPASRPTVAARPYTPAPSSSALRTVQRNAYSPSSTLPFALTSSSSPAPVVPKNSFAPSSGATSVVPSAVGIEVARLNAAEQQVFDRYQAHQEVRRKMLTVITSLQRWNRERTPAAEACVEKAVEKYMEVREMKRLGSVVLALSAAALTGCSSVDGEIAKLNGEERELYDRIQVLQEERKKLLSLIVCMQQTRSTSGPQVAKAREAYEAARARAN